VARAGLAAHLLSRGADQEASWLALQALPVFAQGESRDQFGLGFMTYLKAKQLDQQGRHAEAEKLFRELHELAERYLGAEHPITGALLADFTGFLRRRGRLPEAEKIFRKVMDMVRKSPLRSHPQAIGGFLTAADILRERGDVQEAEQIYREALQFARERYDEANPLVQRSLAGVTALLRQRGRRAEADALMQAIPKRP
jgi:tetratricopeptide (TPR) repeat protein